MNADEHGAVGIDPDDELPLSDDEILVQHYLDGTLSEGENDAVERRMEHDPTFAEEVGTYAALFSALDHHASIAPPDLAEEAVAGWAPVGAGPWSGWADAFGGIKPAVAAFFVLDALLAGLLAGMIVTHGPLTLLKAWILGLKDIVVFVARWAPPPDVLVVALPVAMIALAAALGGIVFSLRVVLARAAVRP